jgi:hypothetical protein
MDANKVNEAGLRVKVIRYKVCRDQSAEFGRVVNREAVLGHRPDKMEVQSVRD